VVPRTAKELIMITFQNQNKKLRLNFSWLCLKCIILVTNFQISPSARIGDFPPPTPPYPFMLVTWSCVIWPDCFFQTEYNDKIELEKTTSRHRYYATEKLNQIKVITFFYFAASSSNQNCSFKTFRYIFWLQDSVFEYFF